MASWSIHNVVGRVKINDQSINLFRFPSIHLQGLNHKDIEIVKNTSLAVKYSKSQC